MDECRDQLSYTGLGLLIYIKKKNYNGNVTKLIDTGRRRQEPANI